MEKIKPENLSLCKLQANLFAKSIELDCSSPIFIRRFMNSKLAEQFDDGSIMQSAVGINGMFQLIEEEYGKSHYGKKKYSSEELFWIGYIYRYWQCTYETSSRLIYKIITGEGLRALYYSYHTLSASKCIMRIMDERGIEIPDVDQRQLNVLRELIKEEADRISC